MIRGFISLAGSAELSNDRAKIKELWSKFDKALAVGPRDQWARGTERTRAWDDATDPDIRLLTVTPETAE